MGFSWMLIDVPTKLDFSDMNERSNTAKVG